MRTLLHSCTKVRQSIEVQICIWPSWCHCHSLSLASIKSRLVLVPAYPGNPGQSPEVCEMDVCVCMCACVCACLHVNYSEWLVVNDWFAVVTGDHRNVNHTHRHDVPTQQLRKKFRIRAAVMKYTPQANHPYDIMRLFCPHCQFLYVSFSVRS